MITVMSTVSSASLLAHGLHYLMVLAGLVGLVLLLAPQALERFRRVPSPPRDEHETRIRDLRARAAAGVLTAPRPAGAVAVVTAPVRRDSTSRLVLPVALVSSAAAAGAHAAVGPAHLSFQALFGVFFILCSIGQLAWTSL